MSISVDVWSVSAFLGVFAANVYGPNKEHMYILDELSEQQALQSITWLAIVLVVNILQALILVRLARETLPAAMMTRALNYFSTMMEHWYWLIFWLVSSTSLAGGSCMIMKHDGMDLTFRFLEWNGTNPF